MYPLLSNIDVIILYVYIFDSEVAYLNSLKNKLILFRDYVFFHAYYLQLVNK